MLPDGFDTIFSAANFTSINNFGGTGGRLREPCVLVVSFCLTRNTGFRGLGEGEGGDAERFCFVCGVTDKRDRVDVRSSVGVISNEFRGGVVGVGAVDFRVIELIATGGNYKRYKEVSNLTNGINRSRPFGYDAE